MIRLKKGEPYSFFMPRTNLFSNCNHRDFNGHTRLKNIGIRLNGKSTYVCMNCGAEIRK